LGVRKRSYRQDQKVEYLKEADAEKERGSKFPLQVISQRHNIPAKTLYKWDKDTKLRNNATPSKKRKLTTGRPLKSPAATDLVIQKASEFREQKLPVSGKAMALLLKSDMEDEFGLLPIPKVRRVVYRIFERNHWTVRQVTNDQTILDEQQLGDAKIAFVQSFNQRVAEIEVPNDLVINMDETPSKFMYSFSLL
jgi:hypothetical protein